MIIQHEFNTTLLEIRELKVDVPFKWNLFTGASMCTKRAH